MDESYSLIIGAPGSSGSNSALPACSITAGTFVGAVWAMETLSQLILSEGGSLQHHTDGHPHQYSIMNAPWEIKDQPRFQYRGLMIDTSRHFLPVNAIRRQIDGLSFNRMNVLHWHMTDAQSTPYDSTVHPKLKEGAFSEGAVYTPKDIKGLVEYARLRGVQVSPSSLRHFLCLCFDHAGRLGHDSPSLAPFFRLALTSVDVLDCANEWPGRS
jgi:hexosaminidase